MSNFSAKQFQRDVGFTLFAKTLYLLTRVALPPLILAHVTLAEYGMWSIAFIVISYLGLTATGFASVYIRSGALAHQRNDVEQLSRLISTGILVLSGVSLVLFVSLWLGMPWVMDMLNVKPDQRATAQLLVLGSCGVFLLDMSLGAYAYLLHGLGRIRQEQSIWVVAYLVEMVAVLLLLWGGWGIASLLWAFVVRYMVSISSAAWLVHRSLPGLRLHWSGFDRGVLKEFMGYGSLVQASSLLANALHSAERVLAGLFLGAQAAALFDLGNKLPSTATSIPSAVSSVAMPAAARSQGRTEVCELYLRSTRMTGLLTAFPMPFLALFALPLCQLWLGQRTEVLLVAAIMSVLSMSCHVHILTGPGSAILRGTGSASNEFIYHGLRIGWLSVCVAGVWWAQRLDAAMLANAVAVAGVGAALCYLLWNHRHLSGSFGGFASQVMWPALAGYPVALLLWPVGALLWPAGGSGRWSWVGPLAVVGLAYAVLLALTLYITVLSPSEKAWLKTRLARWLGRSTPASHP